MVFSKQKSDAQAFSPEAIKKIKDTFWENHETLVNLQAVYENSDAGEDPEQSFEQGYENGMQYVCEMLGIDLEPDNEDSETYADAYLRVHGKEL